MSNNELGFNMFKPQWTFVLFACLLGFFSGFSQVKSSIDTTSIRIGEEIKFSISIEADSSARVTFPEGQTFLPLEVIEFYSIDTTFEQAKIRLIKKYGLTQFDSGKYVLPRQAIKINETVFYTDSLLVEVADVVVDTTKQKMFDIKALIDVPPVKGDWLRYLLWIVLALLVISGIIYLLIQRKKKIEEAKRQLPPYEEALVALQTLDNSEYLKNNQVKDYYSTLTEIVKRYLDREVDEAALESTTEELIDRLKLHKDSGHLDFDQETIAKLNLILKRADLIKFAKMQMESGQAQLDRKDIENIINETHEVIPEPTEEELLQDALYQEQLLKKKKKKKQTIIIGSMVSLLLVAYVVLSLVFGLQTVKDTIFGNYTKSLAEATWIKSEYGSPAVILETPDVLFREIDTISHAILSKGLEDVFTFGDIQNKVFILVGSTKISDGQQVNLETVLEEKLMLLETNGATNLIVKNEPFSTEKGVSGIRAYGEFNIRVADNKFKKEKSEYELLLFAQDGAIQVILIVNEKDDLYAKQIKERILKSVELEVIKKQ
ncbi:MAG: DUF4381 domain-containing protein [Flavobacteriaceae bacterium CG_4_8_14_3_um_filter_34_10]|nr:DUF4381 domain-containing protein [Flavobacteriia bacterium]OIP50700.1 MAG: hypothetical protein AUK33_07035 [Flavobacteriaceae bacterium CG2_30_34_30]PIQ18103.1 MAG: DUF4381 domain-containing protein [Flavobacteriaceae bacterium CG18_big_fil_WC_8_21_14_2_50_34_36]PIV51282.1 MAG: DUF4381 domain-containing protein [Flavobacteriaceae bacterium CG02_land_8_20_14_3_00_34_13]PIX10270.1 MAG: DUF4381 domain-containing protein [Flavobacteriaceae bacterium CG_4_8_14_3_um_filter_34_10]PIZ08587.1 MAG: